MHVPPTPRAPFDIVASARESCVHFVRGHAEEALSFSMRDKALSACEGGYLGYARFQLGPLTMLCDSPNSFSNPMSLALPSFSVGNVKLHARSTLEISSEGGEAETPTCLPPR